MTLSMKELAKVGAKARLTEIQTERDALLQMFPELNESGRRGRKPASNGAAPAKLRRRRAMSAEQRKAVGARMKAYWAARRAAKVNGPGEGAQAGAASQNGSTSRKSGRKQGRKK